MNYHKGSISKIALVGGALILASTFSYAVNTYRAIPAQPGRQIACSQEAKQCPDGSYVGRTGPNCQFAPCPRTTITPRPTPKPSATPIPGKQIILREGQRADSLLLQKMYPTYIAGLNFREYPVATNQGQPIILYIGQTASNGCTISLTLVSINYPARTATFVEKKDFSKPCPICLAQDTLIDTPQGKIPVQDLRQGMAVWTVDAFGKRVLGTILKTAKTPVPATHQMVHVVLNDGREILASPGHPIGDGRIFNDLSVGDVLDGSRIITVEKVPYGKGYAYDILPSGATGFYVANGILIDSTLR